MLSKLKRTDIHASQEPADKSKQSVAPKKSKQENVPESSAQFSKAADADGKIIFENEDTFIDDAEISNRGLASGESNGAKKEESAKGYETAKKKIELKHARYVDDCKLKQLKNKKKYLQLKNEELRKELQLQKLNEEIKYYARQQCMLTQALMTVSSSSPVSELTPEQQENMVWMTYDTDKTMRKINEEENRRNLCSDECEVNAAELHDDEEEAASDEPGLSSE